METYKVTPKECTLTNFACTGTDNFVNPSNFQVNLTAEGSQSARTLPTKKLENDDTVAPSTLTKFPHNCPKLKDSGKFHTILFQLVDQEYKTRIQKQISEKVDIEEVN